MTIPVLANHLVCIFMPDDEIPSAGLDLRAHLYRSARLCGHDAMIGRVTACILAGVSLQGDWDRDVMRSGGSDDDSLFFQIPAAPRRGSQNPAMGTTITIGPDSWTRGSGPSISAKTRRPSSETDVRLIAAWAPSVM